MTVQIDLGLLAPMLVLAGTGVLALLLAAFRGLAARTSGYLALAAVLVAFGLTVIHAGAGRTSTPFANVLTVDGFSLAFDLTLLVAASLTVLFSLSSGRYLNRGEYYALLLFSLTGMMIMAHGVNLLTLFIGLEMLSVPIYALTGFDRENPRSSEAALKYFLLGAFAAAFLLYGMALLYGATGTLALDRLGPAIAGREAGDPFILTALGLIIVGLAFKLSLVPFHMWTPDAYDGAPTPVAGFMSVGTKAAVFAALLRLVPVSLASLQDHAQTIFYALAVLSMTVGNLTALTQRNIKRMLAFSSVAQAGYMLIGVVVGRELGFAAILFYLMAYAFMNIGAFGVVVLLERDEARKGDPELGGFTLSDLIGLGKRRPLMAAAMALFMFSLIGIPPTAGFLGKFYLFAGAVKAHYYLLAVVGVLNSAVAAYYYLRVVVTMYMKEPEETAAARPVPAAGSIGLILAAAGTVALGLAPAGLFAFMVSVIDKL